MQITVENLLKDNNLSLPKILPHASHKTIYYLFNKLIKSKEINQFIEDNSDKFGIDFIEELFDYLNFSYFLSSLDKLKIPSEGKLVVVSNHPLGALDGLALLKAISEVRKDVCIIANDLLLYIDNLKDLFLPYNVFSLKAQKNNINQIEQALKDNKVVIFFPSATVSRFSINGIKDEKWHKGALKFAQKLNAPILPVFIEARNSSLFYLTSIINKSFSKFLLPRELFKKSNCSIKIKIGNLIPNKSLNSISSTNELNRLLRKHTYKLQANKEIFKTEKTVIHPIENKIILRELEDSQFLGSTNDGKTIYCTTYETGKNVIKEIARLREITFRKVGEGTGKKYDYDKFDKIYKHIVLWDNNENEIVGSYRLGICSEIIDKVGINGLYNSEEFIFNDSFKDKLPKSVELGRSFIQEKYWNTSALDNLWQGIGIYLQSIGNITHLFGAVSISDRISPLGKAMIVYVYNKWFGEMTHSYISPKNPYSIEPNLIKDLENKFNSDKYDIDFKNLKTSISKLGFSIPVMFRRYSSICEADGVKILGFNIDKNFSNCLDGFIMIEIDKLKYAYKLRYNFITNALSEEVSINEVGKLLKSKENEKIKIS